MANRGKGSKRAQKERGREERKELSWNQFVAAVRGEKNVK